MICFCAERFHWRRIWQNPGELLIPGLADVATRGLLYRRPYEPSRLLVKHGSQIYSVRLRRHRRARRYTLRIHPSDREAILTIPPRGTIAEAKDFALGGAARSVQNEIGEGSSRRAPPRDRSVRERGLNANVQRYAPARLNLGSVHRGSPAPTISRT